jgi:serine/threonine-protein kinase HipA
MASKTTLNAKNLETLGAAPGLAPICDVSTVLSWPHVLKTYAQSIGGKKWRPDSIVGRHWEALAREVGYRPTYVKSHVEQLVSAMVANRVKVTAEVSALAGATKGYVVQTAEAVEANALRMMERL